MNGSQVQDVEDSRVSALEYPHEVWWKKERKLRWKDCWKIKASLGYMDFIISK